MGTAEVQNSLWSARACDWAELQEVAFEPLYRAAFEAAQLGTQTELLDVGCGSGLALSVAKKLGAIVSGLDAAEALIAIACSRLPDSDLVVGELEELPFRDRSFDVVTGFNSFQYASDRIKGLREARRVMRPDGRLVAAVWGEPDQCQMSGYLAALGSLSPPTPAGSPGPWALSPPGALEELANQAELKTINSSTVTCVFRFEDERTAVRGLLGAGPAERAIRASGEVAVARAILEAIKPFKRSNGSYELSNTLRYIVVQRL